MTWDLLSEQHGYAFLATTAPDGSPRLHPVAPIITPTGIHLAISAGSPKLRDLRRDPRLALHSSVRPPSDDELALRGRAVPVRDEDRRRTVERERLSGAELHDSMELLGLVPERLVRTTCSGHRPVGRGLGPARPRGDPRCGRRSAGQLREDGSGNRTVMSERTAVVTGARIGGLAATIGLRAAGWDVTVLERDAEPRGAGAGISLWSNGLRALDLLGVGDTIRAHGTIQGQGGIRTHTGRWRSRSSGERLAAETDLSVLILHRAELHACLLAAVVVGADGVRSGVRRAVLSDSVEPAHAGFTAWRGVTDGPYRLEQQSESWGRGSVFGLTQLPDERVYWFATAGEPAGSIAGDEHAEVLRRFGSWHAPIGDVVRSTAPGSVLRHDIHAHRRPLSPFAVGRVALLGDAAHAVTPNLGQGGCLALEDAVVLAAELRKSSGVDDALARHDAVRRPRAERISAMSERTTRLAQAANPLVAAARSLLVAATPSRVAATSLARTVA